MIKSNKLKVLLLIAGLGLSGSNYLQAQSLKVPTASTLQKVTQGFALSEIQLEYSRPGAKGRTVFGDLVPFGKVWRTGANQSTKITFGEDVKVNGKDVKAGTYAIYSVPGEKEWKISLYSDLNLGGNVAGYDVGKEVAAFNVPVKKLADKIETFTIQIDDITNTSANITLAWENTAVSFNVTADIDAKVMTGIENAMKDNRPYGQAASYYLENGKDLNQAYEWIQKAVEQAPYAFWMIYRQAKIEHELGKHEAAIATATVAKTKAAEAKNDDYVKMSDELIQHCQAELKKVAPKKK